VYHDLSFATRVDSERAAERENNRRLMSTVGRGVSALQLRDLTGLRLGRYNSESNGRSMARPRLVAINPPGRKTRELRLAKAEITIGSEKGNTLRLRDQSVSRRHAVIRYRDGRYVLRDLQSTNGTFVNEQRVRVQILLKDGDHVRFGGVRFVFLDPRPAAARMKRRLTVLRAVELALLLFGAGFGLAEYTLNRELASEEIRKIFRRDAATPLSTLKAQFVPTAAVVRTAKTAAASRGVRAIAVESPRVAATPRAPRPVEADWLARINYYRAMAKLPPVKEDRALTKSDAKHARYVILNYGEAIREGGGLAGGELEEQAGRPGYSEDGAAIARNSEDAYGCGPFSAADEIDRLMASPFHRLAILSPGLDSAGFGSYAEGGCWTATIRLPVPLSNPQIFDQPIEFPPDGTTVSLGWMPGEWPEPLVSCPGYSEPAGLPITLQLGRRIHGQLSAHSLSDNGRPVKHCAFDNAIYTHPNASAQEYARRVLRDSGAVALIPQEPLKDGATYTVSITARGQTYTWSFKTATSGER
jgi:uncharacterized protein YkwD